MHLSTITRKLHLLNYAPKTQTAYTHYAIDYIAFAKKNGIKNRDHAIEEYILFLKRNNLTSQTISLALCAIKFLYREILLDSRPIPLTYPKRSNKLPAVLSRQEILSIIHATSNSQYRLMIALAYGCGLRVSEVTRLKGADLCMDELTVHIKQSKGNKDRISIVPASLRQQLNTILSRTKRNDYIFPSNRGGKLTTTSLQKMFRKSLAAAGIKKNATFHSLRHSFATHLLENGTDIRYVQALLGHANVRTTQGYTRVTRPAIQNIVSPLSDYTEINCKTK